MSVIYFEVQRAAAYLSRIRSPTYVWMYLMAVRLLLVPLFTLFLFIYFYPSAHSAPPPHPPEALTSRSIPYEVINLAGDFDSCWQDSCNGRWLPPRTRHCKDCRRCRMEYDHCCPWFGPNCISRDTLKAFILFLSLTPSTIAVVLWEVIPIALTHVRCVRQQYWPALYAIWWNRWYSWIGGPLFRVGGGTLLSYWYYAPSVNGIQTSAPPLSLGPLILSVVGTVLAILTIFLLSITVSNVIEGSSTLETERAKIRNHQNTMKYVWLPELTGKRDENGRHLGRVAVLPRDTKLYNFGLQANWENLFGDNLLDCISV